MNEFNNCDNNNEPNFNFKRIKMILIAVTIIFFLLTISVFLFNKNKNYNEVKNELLTNTWTLEDEYFLKLIEDLQKTNDDIPSTENIIKQQEKWLRYLRLRRRCLDYELERIVTNKGYTPWFCDSDENLEQFSTEKQTQTAKSEPKIETVVF